MNAPTKPTATDVRNALREYFEAKSALEASELHARFVAARKRVVALSERNDYDMESALGRLVELAGAELFTAASSTLQPTQPGL